MAVTRAPRTELCSCGRYSLKHLTVLDRYSTVRSDNGKNHRHHTDGGCYTMIIETSPTNTLTFSSLPVERGAAHLTRDEVRTVLIALGSPTSDAKRGAAINAITDALMRGAA